MTVGESLKVEVLITRHLLRGIDPVNTKVNIKTADI